MHGRRFQHVFGAIDTNDSKTISWSEFAAYYCQEPKVGSEQPNCPRQLARRTSVTSLRRGGDSGGGQEEDGAGLALVLLGHEQAPGSPAQESPRDSQSRAQSVHGTGSQRLARNVSFDYLPELPEPAGYLPAPVTGDTYEATSPNGDSRLSSPRSRPSILSRRGSRDESQPVTRASSVKTDNTIHEWLSSHRSTQETSSLAGSTRWLNTLPAPETEHECSEPGDQRGQGNDSGQVPRADARDSARLIQASAFGLSLQLERAGAHLAICVVDVEPGGMADGRGALRQGAVTIGQLITHVCDVTHPHTPTHKHTHTHTHTHAITIGHHIDVRTHTHAHTRTCAHIHTHTDSTRVPA